MQIEVPDDAKGQALAAGFFSVEDYVVTLLDRDAERLGMLIDLLGGVPAADKSRARALEEVESESQHNNRIGTAFLKIEIPDRFEERALAVGFSRVEDYVMTLLDRDAEDLAMQGGLLEGLQEMDQRRGRALEEFEGESQHQNRRSAASRNVPRARRRTRSVRRPGC